MYKFFTLASALLLAVALLTLTGCDAIGGRETSSYVVGSWFWDEDSSFEYHFNADGTGTRGTDYEYAAFSWSARGTTLSITCEEEMFGVRRERWVFSVEDHILTLTSQQSQGMTYSYIRDGQIGVVSDELVGKWYWGDNNFWSYTFNQDGTGHGGWSFEEYNFIWGVTDQVLRVAFTDGSPDDFPRIATWTFSVAGNALNLTSPGGYDFTYFRDDRSWEVLPELVGTWLWDENPDWIYIFNANGTAIRGFSGEREELTWSTYGNELRFFYDGNMMDSWYFTISDDLLRVVHVYDEEFIFYYIRDNAYSGERD